MKYKGQKLEGAAEEILVIPRQSGNIVFRIRAILDYDECDKLDPKPIPPTRLLPGGKSGRQQENVEDPKYKKAIDEWAHRRTLYMIIKSLEPSEDIEWEQVKLAEPNTWINVDQEFADSGFTAAETTHIIRSIMQVNGLDSEKIKSETESFLALVAKESQKQLSQNSELSDMPSGEPAND